MGISTDYPNVPEWVSKSTGYQAGSMVKYKGNIFYAAFWASEPGVGDADHNGWRFYDELYDLTPHTPTQEAKIIAYIPTWRKKEGFNYANEEMYQYITHGIIAFLMFSETNLGEFDPTSVDNVNAILPDVVNTGHRKGTRISIALGGASDYGFLNLMTAIGNNPANPLLDKAVQNVVDFVKSNGLDGVDLDLECWWDKNSDASKDQGGRLKSEGPHPAGYALTLFAQKLKQAMPDKLVSVPLFGTSWYGNNYDSKIADYVDWLAIMTYDLTGSWNASPVGPHSALFKIRNQDSAKISNQEFSQESYTKEQQGEWPGGGILNNPILSVEDTLWYWTNPLFVNSQGAGQNISRNKIAAGVPLYGHDFAYGQDPDDLSGQIPPGYKTIGYKEILAQFPDAHTAANGNIKVPGNTPRPPFVSAAGTYPYAHNIYLETPDTAATKLNFLKSVGAQGVIIWELSSDVWEEGKSILKALYKKSGYPETRKAIGSDLEAGTSVGDGDFGKADSYDRGVAPAIALNSENVVVEVHQSGDANTLWYHVGKVDRDKITWGGSIYYDDGILPSVAINNDGLVVEVHEKGASDGTLWYHVGRVEDNKINWGGSIYLDHGLKPSVAITNDGLVVEVHETDGGDGRLWYHIGRVDGDNKIINWGEGTYLDHGLKPSVAITTDGLVVEAHETDGGDGTLWYHIGRVDGDNKIINWGGGTYLDNGLYPSVAITNDGLVIMVYHSQPTPTGIIVYNVGKVAGDKINWQNNGLPTIILPLGVYPKVACNGILAVETHLNFNQNPQYNLECSVLTLPAFRSNWIQLQGDNSYFYCACNSDATNKQRHASDHTMTIKEGAPYLYAVLTKDDDTADFPDGAVLTIEGPDGTQYDRDIQEDNQLVIMSGSSIRSLIIKDPKPGDWKMTMTVPEGVGFHCECNTVPSKDPYKTITDTLSTANQLQKRGLYNESSWKGWIGAAATGMAAGAAIGSFFAPGVGTLIGGFFGFVVGGYGYTLYKVFVSPASRVTLDDGAGYLHSLAKTNSTGAATGEILLMDTNADKDIATTRAYKRRKDILFPYIEGSKYKDKKTSLLKDEMTRANVKTNLEKTSVIYCTASGHGLAPSLYGRLENDVFEEVISLRHYEPAEAQNKIFHFLACLCGYRTDTFNGIGADLVKNGAKAFFGYSKAFVMVVDNKNEFCDCDIEIDLAFIEGGTAGEVYTRAIAKFNEKIKRLNVDGYDVAAAYLEGNRDMLVAPSTDKAYGDINAKL
jgi:GH18 family chitinase